MRAAAVVVMLVAVGLSGCFGGSDEALDPSAIDSGSALPTLPEGLEMDGAKVVSYNETSVTWRWESEVDLGACCVPEPVDNAATTNLEAAPGVDLAFQATTTSPAGGPRQLYVSVRDGDGGTLCTSPIACGGTAQASDEEGSWSVTVDNNGNLGEPIPFVLYFTLAVAQRQSLESVPRAGETPADAGPAPGPHAVIAFSGTGINPYHHGFRDTSPEAFNHPSTYLAGYPEDAQPLHLTLDAPTYGQAIAADDEVWESVEPGRLYWIPGTRIVGAILPEGGQDEWGDGVCQPVLDCEGHGTAVASRGATGAFGLCGTCKVVAVQATHEGFTWVDKQDWIDISSNSWASPGNAPAVDDARMRSKPTFITSSNGFVGILGEPAYQYHHQSLPNAILVGGHDNGRVILWSGSNPHVVADAYPDVALHLALEGAYSRGGSSHATAYAAGAGARLVLEARTILDDRVGTVDEGVLARGEPELVSGGPLEDGQFTVDELKHVLFNTAQARPAEGRHDGHACEPLDGPNPCAGFAAHRIDWKTIPDGVPQYYVIGYGAVNEDTLDHAKRVLRGEEDMPERPVEDAFFALDQEVRKALVEADP